MKKCNLVISPNIREIIKDKCLKQASVAEKAGYSQAMFSNILCGRKIATDADILRIAKALGVSAGELFGERK